MTSFALASAILAIAAVAGAQRAPAQQGLAGSPAALGAEALERHELARADSAFGEAMRSADPEVRAAGTRGAALIRWRYHGDFAAGRRMLAASDSAEHPLDRAAARLELARLHRAAGRWSDAARAARLAADSAFAIGEPDLARDATRELALAAAEPVLVLRVDGGRVPARQRVSDATLRDAVARLATFVRASPGHADDSFALLSAALAAGDGAAAYAAWRSYFLGDVGDGRFAALTRADRELARLLPAWRGGGSAALRGRIAAALAASRLYDAAALAATSGGAPDAAAAELVAYDAYCRALTRAADEYYRRTALGLSKPDELQRAQLRLARDLWPKLAWPASTPPRYFPAAADSEIARRFGALWAFGTTAGYPDLHYGHQLAVEQRVVRQYGRTVSVRFVALEGIVSNGFQSWAWEGRGAHAGWQLDRTIVQLRAMSPSPATLWELEADSAHAAAADAALALDSAADVARLPSIDAVAYLPGVAGRIARDGRRALLDSLRGAGLAGDALREAFMREIAHDVRDAALFTHEGRHAIDAGRVPPLSTEEREYRAKLAEVAFAARPKLALGAILHPSVGDATPHGQANARVLRGVVAWMREHAAEIRGLDPARPLLLQLALLDDAQLRAAFRSLDPLARSPD